MAILYAVKTTVKLLIWLGNKGLAGSLQEGVLQGNSIVTPLNWNITDGVGLIGFSFRFTFL